MTALAAKGAVVPLRMAPQGEPLHYDSDCLWPDETWGPWCLELHWDFIDGRWALSGLSIRSCLSSTKQSEALALARGRFDQEGQAGTAPPGHPRELTSRELRSLRLADIVQREQTRWQRLLVDGGGPTISSPAREPADAHAGPGRPQLYGEDHYAEVARVYADAYRNQSRNPTMKVAKDYQISRSTAAKWVAKARALGFLDSTEERVAGGVSSAPVHTVGLTAVDGPPFVRFSGAQASRRTVWISCPSGASLARLTQLLAQDRALRERIGQRGAARVLIEYLGHRLSPAEDALLERFTAHRTGPDFWRAVDEAGLSAEEGGPTVTRRRGR